MRTLHRPFLAAVLAILTGTAAFAGAPTTNFGQDPEHAREQIERLYRLEQAFLTCDRISMTGHDLKRLDEEISEAEYASGLPSSELEALYEEVETAAAQSPENLCADPAATGDALRAIPASKQQR